MIDTDLNSNITEWNVSTPVEDSVGIEPTPLEWTDAEKIAMLEEDHAMLHKALRRIIRTKPHLYTVVPGGKPTIARANDDVQQIARETLDLLQEKAYERTIRKLVANDA